MLLNKQLLLVPGPLLGHDDNIMLSEGDQSQMNWDKLLEACEPIENFLEYKKSSGQEELESSCLHTDVSALEKPVLGSLNQYAVPLSLIERWGSAMGIL